MWTTNLNHSNFWYGPVNSAFHDLVKSTPKRFSWKQKWSSQFFTYLDIRLHCDTAMSVCFRPDILIRCVAVQDCCKVDLCFLCRCHTWRNNPTNRSKETNHRQLEKGRNTMNTRSAGTFGLCCSAMQSTCNGTDNYSLVQYNWFSDVTGCKSGDLHEVTSENQFLCTSWYSFPTSYHLVTCTRPLTPKLVL